MKVSWFIPKPFPDRHRYILNTYLMISKKLKGIRIDLSNGEEYYGNKIPSKRLKSLFDIVSLGEGGIFCV